MQRHILNLGSIRQMDSRHRSASPTTLRPAPSLYRERNKHTNPLQRRPHPDIPAAKLRLQSASKLSFRCTDSAPQVRPHSQKNSRQQEDKQLKQEIHPPSSLNTSFPAERSTQLLQPRGQHPTAN